MIFALDKKSANIPDTDTREIFVVLSKCGYMSYCGIHPEYI